MKKLLKIKHSVTSRVLAMKFAGEFILIYPLVTIMFGDRAGIGAGGIGVLIASVLVLGILFEIPTGVLADKIPRKYVLVTGLLSKIGALSFWLYFESFGGYLLAAALLALGEALESGAIQAYLYGVLGKESKQFFGKFWARVSAMVMVSYTIAYAAASFIGPDYTLLLALSIASCLIALGIAISLPTDTISKAQATSTSRIRSLLTVPKLAVSVKELIFVAVIVVALSQMLIEYMAQYFQGNDVDIRYIPLILAISNSFGAILFWTLHNYEMYLEKFKVIITISVTTLFALSFYSSKLGIILGLVLVVRYARVLQVSFDTKLQHLLIDDTRATVTSIASFASKLLASSMVVIVGVFAVNNNITVPLRVTIIAGFAIYLLLDMLRANKLISTNK